MRKHCDPRDKMEQRKGEINLRKAEVLQFIFITW